MDSSGSLERASRLRFALQTPSQKPCPEDSDDGSTLRAERSISSGSSGRADRLDRTERSDRPERNDRPGSGSRVRNEQAADAPEGDQIILLIEDNPQVVTAIAHCLHGAGYQTLCAADVEDAVRKVQSRAVSLVLLNWGLLLRIGGSELIGQLRTSSPRARLPMVVISDEVSALNEASSLGIEDYVLDPFQLEDLLHVVDEHCC